MRSLPCMEMTILQHAHGSEVPSPASAKKSADTKVPALKKTARKKGFTPTIPAYDVIVKTIDDAQAEEIFTVDLAGKSSLADHMIICSGRSARHVVAIAEHILKALSENGFAKCRTEGESQGDWVLIDQGDVIIHIFRPEVRAFYNLEKIWGESRPQELPTSAENTH